MASPESMDPESARPASRPVHAVRAARDIRIPVRDGLELSANLWLPEPVAGAASTPTDRWPAILEMIPYRKDDWRANGDEARGRYLAERGYAFCRLDIRGTGSSPGIATDEYAAAETQDGYDAVEWLAAQPWCSGAIGMWGISYGGFTAIQVAKLRPPHLRAIVPMYATDDRYTDDVHFLGGCVTGTELTQYAVSMIAGNALPPRPAYRGPAWVDEWRQRLERTPVWSFEWLRRQHDGPYWRQGSLAPEYEAIDAAMLLIGGWMDSYVDPVFRMVERCRAPRRALVGNWVHEYPDDGYPGPNLDWLHELVRFFDHHLKGLPNGEDLEPGLAWFEREWAPPEAFPRAWPGRWRAARAYPVEGTAVRRWRLADGEAPLSGRLVEGAAPIDPGAERFPHRATLGTRGALSWGSGSAPNGLARDLRPDESLVPVYSTAPLATDVHLLGMPVAVLDWESEVPIATAVARLSDVAPDGTPTQITAGVLNLTHRESRTAPAPLEPGRRVVVRVPMRSAGYRFRAGHRIRLSIASGAWPVIWPSPLAGEVTLHHGDQAALELPCVPPDDDVAAPAWKTTPPLVESIGGGSDEPATWQITEDVIAGSVTVTTFEGGETITADGTRLYSSESHALTARDADPARAEMVSQIRYRMSQDGHEIEADADARTSSSAEAFEMAVELRVRLDGEPFFERAQSETIPRQLA